MGKAAADPASSSAAPGATPSGIAISPHRILSGTVGRVLHTQNEPRLRLMKRQLDVPQRRLPGQRAAATALVVTTDAGGATRCRRRKPSALRDRGVARRPTRLRSLFAEPPLSHTVRSTTLLRHLDLRAVRVVPPAISGAHRSDHGSRSSVCCNAAASRCVASTDTMQRSLALPVSGGPGGDPAVTDLRIALPEDGPHADSVVVMPAWVLSGGRNDRDVRICERREHGVGELLSEDRVVEYADLDAGPGVGSHIA